MINTNLLKPGNLLIITAIVVLTHMLAKPLYNSIDSK